VQPASSAQDGVELAQQLFNALMSEFTGVFEAVNFPFERFNAGQLDVQFRFRLQGAFFGGRAVIPLPFHKLHGADDTILKG
jgi:hypothetical protein